MEAFRIWKVWFARELSWRHGRIPTVIGFECASSDANVGGTAESLAFRPAVGRRVKAFFIEQRIRIDKEAFFNASPVL